MNYKFKKDYIKIKTKKLIKIILKTSASFIFKLLYNIFFFDTWFFN